MRSARYAGEHASDEENLAKLLREAPAGSPLEYVCVIAYVDRGRRRAAVRGPLRRARSPSARAASGGSAMTRRSCPTRPAPAGLTMAELSDEQKDAISHRGRAARALLAWLREQHGAG